MIKLRRLIYEIIAERMTYSDLMNSSTPERKDRGSRIPAKSLAVKSINDREAWKFSYKTPKDEITKDAEFPNGTRHQGFIYFFKEGIIAGEDAMKIDCSVDCSCKDYRYRLSYANKQAGAGENGPNSLNKGLNYPSSINVGPGLCKHLIALKEYLRTKIEGEPTSPKEPIQGIKPKVIPKSPPPEKTPTEEPEPEEEPEIPKDPTQAPDIEKKPETEPEEPKTSETPEGPDEEEPETEEEPKQGLEPGQPEEEPEKKLKENIDKTKIVQMLDNVCKNNRIFILKYD